MWNRGGLWLGRIRLKEGGRCLCMPVPVYVLGDLLESAEDICALILPCLGLPNWAALLREMLCALCSADTGFRVECNGMKLEIQCLYQGGRGNDGRCA